MKTLVWSIALAGLMTLACDKSGDGGAPAKIPQKPANGSPIAAEFVSFTGSGAKRAVTARLYNFGDKTAAGYVILARYYDASDKLIKVKPGTPFEKDTDFMSLAGRKYKCDPKQHATIEIDMLSVPEAAARAELLISKVDAVAADGMKVEDWWSQDRWSEWPE